MKMYGSVDHLGRPYIRVETLDGHSVLLLVDTGANRKIILNRFGVNRIGKNNIQIYPDTYQSVQLADLSVTNAMVGAVKILWFGKEESVDILVTDFNPKRPPREDEPVGLIGTEMLIGCKLLVNFRQGTVEIHSD